MLALLETVLIWVNMNAFPETRKDLRRPMGRWDFNWWTRREAPSLQVYRSNSRGMDGGDVMHASMLPYIMC